MFCFTNLWYSLLQVQRNSVCSHYLRVILFVCPHCCEDVNAPNRPKASGDITDEDFVKRIYKKLLRSFNNSLNFRGNE